MLTEGHKSELLLKTTLGLTNLSCKDHCYNFFKAVSELWQARLFVIVCHIHRSLRTRVGSSPDHEYSTRVKVADMTNTLAYSRI